MRIFHSCPFVSFVARHPSSSRLPNEPILRASTVPLRRRGRRSSHDETHPPRLRASGVSVVSFTPTPTAKRTHFHFSVVARNAFPLSPTPSRLSSSPRLL